MKKNIILFMLICTAAFPLTGIRAAGGISRYVIAVGANNGGDQRERLRFAVSDAQAFVKILNQMGGVSFDRTTVLVEPKRDSLKAELARISNDIAEAKKFNPRIELIFYYSGHSNEDGLLLGKDTYPYKDLRASIEMIPADVKIAVLDSCSSGAFTRIKGGKMLAPFMHDQSQNMRGYAFMTSSSADEASQESDRIGGSFFTHYLIAGLRGAADTGQDGRITLNEAYQYAYRETLNRTERTAGGPQHPNYNIQMTGTGDVILTDLRTGSSHLIIGENISGRIYINNGPVLLAVINKQKGTTVSLAVDEGVYSAVNDNEGILSEMKFTVKKGTNFISVPFEIKSPKLWWCNGMGEAFLFYSSYL